VIIETPRLTIRSLTREDAEFVLRLTNEPSFLSNIGDKGIRDLDDAKRFLAQGTWTSQQHRGLGQFVVELKANGAAIGICGLLYREQINVTDIGFAFFPEYWGRGFAFEAADAVMQYGYSELGLATIVGLTTRDNAPSIRVLEKLGMRFREMVTMSQDDPGTALYGPERKNENH
jgi:RimJ/RimL family protein N-acetyltransferase